MAEPLKVKDLSDCVRMTCPECGEQDFFKEHQTIGETQHLLWDADGGCYIYDEVEYDELAEVEDVVCGSCGATIAVNDDTLADQRNALIEAIRAALAEEHSTTEQERILRAAIARYEKGNGEGGA